MFLVNFLNKSITSSKKEASSPRDGCAKIQKTFGPFDIAHVITVASKHPFYFPQHVYPLNQEEVAEITSKRPQKSDMASLLSGFHITQKQDICETTLRLATDANPRNTFRHSTYVSLTGGGVGNNVPLAFFTDIRENRAQRSACGELMRQLGMLGGSDCVLALHPSGKLYRALDLTVDIVEYAGATCLPAGHLTSPEGLLMISEDFQVNVLSGAVSQIVNFASHVESTGSREKLKINKIMYTSEPMNAIQLAYVNEVFSQNGKPIDFISVLGSAEMGVWAVSDFALTAPQTEDSSDFIFDSRHMIVECLPVDHDLESGLVKYPCMLQEETVGLLVVTSLQRLRTPLVRYVTGDIGSVHRLPESTSIKIGGDTTHLRVLRLYGRDIRHSFNWQGEYFEFSVLRDLFQDPTWAVLKWQVVLDHDLKLVDCESLEIRLMRAEQKKPKDNVISSEELLTQLKTFFCVHVRNEALFYVKLCTLEDFIRSDTGNKVLMFVDMTKSKA